MYAFWVLAAPSQTGFDVVGRSSCAVHTFLKPNQLPDGSPALSDPSRLPNLSPPNPLFVDAVEWALLPSS